MIFEVLAAKVENVIEWACIYAPRWLVKTVIVLACLDIWFGLWSLSW